MKYFISTLLTALALNVSVSFAQYVPYFINEINTTSSTGEPDSSGAFVELRGIVNSGNFRPPGLLFGMQDSSGGISAFNSTKNFGYNVNRGDLVVVRGEIGFYNGLTQVLIDTMYEVQTTTPENHTYDVSASSMFNYTVVGADRAGSVNGNDPSLLAYLGDTLTFNVGAPGHPFVLSTTGVLPPTEIPAIPNNGAVSGVIEWIPSTPGTYYYICEYHPQMVATITIVDNTPPAIVAENYNQELREDIESQFVKVSCLVLDTSDWPSSPPDPAVSAGFNVDAIDNAGNSYVIRIDNNTELFSASAPSSDTVDIQGTVGQFTFNTPYNTGYQLQPYYNIDITASPSGQCVNLVTYPDATIGAVTSVNANGDVDSFGNTHTLKGVVTSPDFREGFDGVEFSMTDGTGSIWVYTPDSSISYMPTVGDSVVVAGRITMSNGVARLSFLNNLFQGGVSSNYDTTVVTGPLGEAEEAELIRINNLSLQGLWDVASGSSFNVNATDGSNSYDIRIDANREVIFNNVLTLQGSFDVVGIGSQFDPSAPRTEGYQILPRFDTDFSLNPTSSIEQIESVNILAFPIPAISQLTVMLRENIDAEANFSINNLSGKQLDYGKTEITNGFVNFNVSALTNGQYILTLSTNNTTFNTTFIVK